MVNKENEKIRKENTTRVILNLPNEIDSQYKEIALKTGMAKSQDIIFALSWYLDYKESMNILPKMLEALKNIPQVDNNKSDNMNK